MTQYVITTEFTFSESRYKEKADVLEGEVGVYTLNLKQVHIDFCIQYHRHREGSSDIAVMFGPVPAFLGALYVDKGLEHCRVFAKVCFFPRLKVK